MYITSVAIGVSVIGVAAVFKFMDEEFTKKHFSFKLLELSEAEKREMEKVKTPRKNPNKSSPIKVRGDNALREQLIQKI